MEIPEWEFNASPNEVDLQQIIEDLNGYPWIMQMAYFAAFKRNAPLTYARFKERHDGHFGCIKL